MFKDQFTPEEIDVIQQLRNDIRPMLKPHMVDAIRLELLSEMDRVFPASEQPPPTSPKVAPVGVIAVIVIIIAIVIVAIIASAPKQPVTQTTPSLPALVIPPTLTPIPEVNSASATKEFTPEVSHTPTVMSASPEVVLPSASAAATGDAILIIDGPVEQINDNVVTIFNISILVDEASPILTEISIGDILHVEGHATTREGELIIVAINVTIINVTTISPPPVNQAPPSNCKVSKNGHIKCDKHSA
ncbi:MAG: hypothetical protein R3E39_20440 [Anaerolineae bacterium]